MHGDASGTTQRGEGLLLQSLRLAATFSRVQSDAPVNSGSSCSWQMYGRNIAVAPVIGTRSRTSFTK
ncbi:hypothetical protein SAMN06272721_12240 [Arthrobacter sp. P2b]|nr:hypothetical protein SAMN06272721_12240 [Arthrobacter sp. P2b]